MPAHAEPQDNPGRGPGPWRRLLPPLLLAGLVLLTFARLVIQPDGLIVDGQRAAFQQHERQRDAAPGNDLTRLFLPHHLRIARAVAETGAVPAWDPTGFGGRPLVGNPQAGLWYPPVWLFWLTGWPSLLGWLTIGHLIGGALGAWRLGRDVGLGEAPSLVAAAAFAISPYLLGHVAAGHVPHVWAVSWYPWAFLAARHARRGSWRGVAGLALSWALCLLAGHPQEAILLGLVLVGWWLADGARWFRLGHAAWADPRGLFDSTSPLEAEGGRHDRGSGITGGWRPGIVFVVLMLTAAIAAVEWLPDAALGSWVREAGHRPSWGSLGQCRVRFENLLQLASPRALGEAPDYFGRDNQWEACLGFGLAVLVLAVLGAWASERRGEVRGWLALAAGSLLFAAGPPLGLFALCTVLFPPLAMLRAPGRALFLTTLAVAVLAGLGLEVLARGGGRFAPAVLMRHTRRILVLAMVLTLAGCLVTFGIGDRLEIAPGLDRHGRALARTVPATVLLGCRRLAGDPVVLATLAGLLAVLAFGERAAGRRRVTLALTVLAVAELVAWGIVLIPVAPASRFLATDPVSAVLAGMATNTEIMHRIHARESVWTNLASAPSNRDRTDIYDRFQVRHGAALYEPLYPLLDVPRPREAADPVLARQNAALRKALLDRLAVGFVVHDQPAVPLDWPLVATVGHGVSSRWIFADPDPLPRAYVVPRVEVVASDSDAIARFPDVPASEAVLATVDWLADRPGPRQPFTAAQITRPAPDRFQIEVTTQAPGLLVVAETWMPGWSARDASGRRLPIHRGNGAQIVVPLPWPGRHHLSLSYHAPALRPAMILTGVGLIVAMVLGAGISPLAHTQPSRLRITHSALKSVANRSRNGQLSQSRTSR